jgi:4-hydroxybenzoate polyprenyltransferase
MVDAIAKYEQIVRWARWSAVAAALTVGALYVINEARHPTLYFVTFILFLLAVFALIGLSLYQWRYKRKHHIHHHG